MQDRYKETMDKFESLFSNSKTLVWAISETLEDMMDSHEILGGIVEKIEINLNSPFRPDIQRILIGEIHYNLNLKVESSICVENAIRFTSAGLGGVGLNGVAVTASLNAYRSEVLISGVHNLIQHGFFSELNHPDSNKKDVVEHILRIIWFAVRELKREFGPNRHLELRSAWLTPLMIVKMGGIVSNEYSTYTKKLITLALQYNHTPESVAIHVDSHTASLYPVDTTEQTIFSLRKYLDLVEEAIFLKKDIKLFIQKSFTYLPQNVYPLTYDSLSDILPNEVQIPIIGCLPVDNRTISCTPLTSSFSRGAVVHSGMSHYRNHSTCSLKHYGNESVYEALQELYQSCFSADILEVAEENIELIDSMGLLGRCSKVLDDPYRTITELNMPVIARE